MQTPAKPNIWERAAAEHERARQKVLELQAKFPHSLHSGFASANPEPRQNCAALHAAITELLSLPKFPPGIDVILAGECPVGGKTGLACFFCEYGHMAECHYPNRCAEAQCSHYRPRRIRPTY